MGAGAGKNAVEGEEIPQNDVASKKFEDALGAETSGIEIDKKTMEGRKADRGFTINIGKTTLDTDLRDDIRAKTHSGVVGRRGDFLELSDQAEKDVKEAQEMLKGRIRRGSINPGVISEAELEKTWKNEASCHIYGKITEGQSPFSEREIVYFGLSPDKILSELGLVFSCLKGCKGASDKGPNQDNFSVTRLKDGTDIYCCMDGHGPNGHFSSERSVRVVPYYIAKSEHFPNDMEKCLEEAYLKAQTDGLGHSVENSYDVQASGTTAVTVVRRGDTMWTAHAGDSRVVMGSENDKKLHFATVDHKPEDAEERKRIEESGGEVRSFKYDDGWVVHRIFVKDRDYPGLCMSRSLGDACMKDHGVIAKPTVSKVPLNMSGKPFLVLASDGVWEFLESDWVVKALVKKLPVDGPTRCVHKLAREAKRRWKQEEGDYCDDITCLLVMLK